MENKFDINHVFIFVGNTGGDVYLPFRNVSYIENNPDGTVYVMTNTGILLVVNETESFGFLEEYKGCVGLK